MTDSGGNKSASSTCNSNTKSTTNDDTTKKWIVAVMDGSLLTTTCSRSASADTINSKRSSNVGETIGKIVTLKDPCTGDPRDYAIFKPTDTNNNDNAECQHRIVEFQDLPSDFSSFMVGRHIVKDGNLYLINPVDPLFLYVASQEYHLLPSSSTSQKSWQPLEQFLEELQPNTKQPVLPRDIHPAITPHQLQHVCMTFENDGVMYFRFDVSKTLQWLHQKQKRLLQCLIRQDQEEQQRKTKLFVTSTNTTTNQNDTDDDDYFYMPDEKPVNATSTPNKDSDDIHKTSSASPPVMISDTKALEIQSLQIVCNYLTETWAEKFVQHLGFSIDQIHHKKASNTKDVVLGSRNEASPSSTTSVPASDTTGYTIQRVVTQTIDTATTALTTQTKSDSKKLQHSQLTAANKRLAKVNTKGMKSIASFFGAPPQKKAKH
ncbi:Ydr279p protein family RNase H2 complex component [Nitzschia inconspicua]|uniref:Ydr279p protein family RNase H2 complex component n=1 Tax=Nitzschia inconspicua TaxID=303405 RepID=A0A9K3L4Y9_9STRA|nr:Ydr279p protein family RNase H2 complex component [Nitzschia inconspicua]